MCCFMRCILYAGQRPPQGTSLRVSLPPYLPSFHAPPFLLSLAPLLPPSSARLLHSLFPSLRPCLRSFVTRSLPQPSLPSFTSAPILPLIIASSLPSLAPSLHYHPFLPHSHPPSFLAPSLPPTLLPASRRPIGKLHCIV